MSGLPGAANARNFLERPGIDQARHFNSSLVSVAALMTQMPKSGVPCDPSPAVP